MKLDKQKAKCALIHSGKTQTQIANELIISRPCVSKAVNGGAINKNTARRLAAALGVPVENLLEDSGKEG